MLLDWFTQDFTALFQQDQRVRVVLWMDAHQQFSGLLNTLQQHLRQSGINLLVYDPAQQHGALWLKWAFEVGPAATEKVILWLPFSQEDLLNGQTLKPLLECFFSGLSWQIERRPVGLLNFLHKHGVHLPAAQSDQDALVRGGGDSALAKYFLANLGRDERFWLSKTLTVAAIEENIIGSLDERLLRFLADPLGEWQALQRAGIASEFCSQLGSRYALASMLSSDPMGWAREFVISLAALEIFQATNKPGDFPFAAKLPAPDFWEGLTAFFDHWRRDRDHLETYQRWAQEIEPSLNLAGWAVTHPGKPDALLSLPEARWQRFMQSLSQVCESESETRAFLTTCRAEAEAEAQGFWARTTDHLLGWSLALKLADLVERIEQVLQSLPHYDYDTSAALVEQYAQSWYQVDLQHWQLLRAVRQTGSDADDYDVFGTLADRFYSRYLEKISQIFYESVKNAPVWPPEGCQSISTLAKTLFEATRQPKAILVVDALRLDLAAMLQQRLGQGELQAYLAHVPSVTWVGMNALTPGFDAHLEIKDGKATLPSSAGGGDLIYRAARWKLLEAAGVGYLGKDKKGNRRDEVHHLHEFTSAQKPSNLPKVLVLFDRGVDEVGHGTDREVIQHFDELLAELERAVRRLQKWGYTEIHIVTDHGFVLLHKDANPLQFAVDKSIFAIADARFGILKPGKYSPTVSVPFSLDPEWQVALAPGLRSFGAPGAFFHGGATLQETVIPHLKIIVQGEVRRMRVKAHLPQTEIHTLAVKIELLPDVPLKKNLFETDAAPIQVRVFLGSVEQPRSREKLVEITPDSSTQNVTLFLNREPATLTGEQIPVQVMDTETGELYATGLTVRAGRDLS